MIVQGQWLHMHEHRLHQFFANKTNESLASKESKLASECLDCTCV